MEDHWITQKQRYELADAYKKDFLGQIEQTQFVEEHSFVKSFNFIKGADLLSCTRLPPYHDIMHRLTPYKNLTSSDMQFVSHRWLDMAHPDPDGTHLRLLRAKLEHDAFYWIDYSCLPQGRRTNEEDSVFRESIARLPSLMFKMNFTVLRSANDGYFTRAWCFFEQLAANIIGDQISYITEETTADGSITEGDREVLEQTLLKESLPIDLLVTDPADLEKIREATGTVITFFKLRLVEHYMTLAQKISDDKYFFAEDPYYLVATCNFSRVMVWVFNKAKQLAMQLSDLCRDYGDQNFFMKMADKEEFRHVTNPYLFPKKVVLDQSRLGWLIINKHSRDSACNLFYIMTSMIT